MARDADGYDARHGAGAKIAGNFSLGAGQPSIPQPR